jgi:hypothetical protein
VIREASFTGKRKPELQAQALALLGVARTIGIEIDRPPVLRTGLSNLLEIRQSAEGRTSIGPVQIQFWLGLRELARLRRDAPSVPARLAQPILDLWISTHEVDLGQTLPPHARALNAEMIAWLKQCRAAGWRLVPPDAAADAEGTGQEP